MSARIQFAITRLSEKVEEKRNEIKRIIARDAESYEGDNKQYNMKDTNEILKDMISEMGFKDMDWTMWLFTKSTTIINNSRSMYLIPIYTLSGNPEIVPGGALLEGCSIHITDEPWLRPKAVIVFIFPPSRSQHPRYSPGHLNP
ncbi:hypothetical protein PABG_05158 [Paracoccidioides brasiliensis Pb03]|uniref:Uncharacterized protein n=1 Tax=Paracoccidioides brasiliensis TaxID=121759 RepID=A0A1D2J8G4_PARBR|nr:hypothetical protein PABG_05158 [Paracoccidioides brasiliensis Pb03]ODH18852.1 hypothetical protein ACO22_06189 [Paracoccidioides brasiliensis]